MDASVLLVGGDDFRSTLLDRIHTLVACTVEVAPSPSEAVPLVQAQQPDLIVVQANRPGCLELCHQIKEQPKLAWIYCLAVDVLNQATPDYDRDIELKTRTEALLRGADAYLWLVEPNFNVKWEVTQPTARDLLLQAQISAGLRMVDSYRELMRTNDILSAIALSDPLTELNNRRALDWEMPRQVQNARLRSEPLSLIMLDVDFFKSINDTYGHPVGDRALQLVASRLRHNLRFRDTLFRYGGEEFVIILSNTDQLETDLVAHRLCRLISEQPFSINDSLDLNITISAGTACLRRDDDPRGASLLRRADSNLLRAKAAGRNRAMSCLDEPCHLDP